MIVPRMHSLRRAAAGLFLSALSAIAAAQTAEVVHSFANQEWGSSVPLVEASGGRLVGVSLRGGAAGRGEIFLLTPDGSGGFDDSPIYTFTADTEGQNPGTVVRGQDGLLYGATWNGGSQGKGIAFRTDENGAFETLSSFAGDSCGRLMLAEDGDFYGSGAYTLCRMDAAGAVTVLKTFTQFDGSVVDALAQGSDGALYGSLGPGLHASAGLVFRMTTSGDYSVVHGFEENGESSSGLVLASDGNLYGTTSVGGGSGYGTIFRIDGAGVFSTVHEFVDTDGRPLAPLVAASDGKLYGSTEGGSLGSGFVFRYDPTGSYETLAPFTPEAFDSRAAMIEAADGKFYGVTQNGGSALLGTVFRSDLNTVEAIYSFHATDGYGPIGRLIQASDGMLYGVTPDGGSSSGGTAFRLDLSGAFETLHAFDVGEGQNPVAGPWEGDGQLFGTTNYGDEATALGTFYRMATDGSITVLHEFSDDPSGAPTELTFASDGNFYGVSGTQVVRVNPTGAVEPVGDLLPFVPQPGLTEGPDGALYGVMSGGGQSGTVFRMTLDGSYSTIHEFSGIDGSTPNGGLLAHSDGYLYGTTQLGGPSTGLGHAAGTVFRVNPAGQFSTVYVFSEDVAGDGDFCNGYLIEASDGSIYGTTAGYLGLAGGSVFRLDAAGNESVVHLFAHNSDDGSSPRQGLIQASDGLLYGTTVSGGRDFYGTVYRIDSSTIVPVTSISPTSGPSAGGTVVTVTGQQFQPGAVVSIGLAATTDSQVSGDTEVSATTQFAAPGVLLHVFVRNPDGSEGSLGKAFLGDFLDVPQADFFHSAVEKIFRDGITAGCGSGNYCRNSSTTRAQMAVFLLRSLLGRYYYPPPATGTVFSDVPADSFAAAWIEDLAARGVTAGCGDGIYCPNGAVTRAQMAVFLLKTLLGTSYVPPTAVGVFGDVPVGSFAADWIEDLYTRDITSGCSNTVLLYCPTSSVTRGQMAAFLVATFNLP